MTKGERIKALREKMGMSQVELADRIAVSKQSLYKYENDIITNIPSDKVEAIAEELHTTPSYIMGWNESMTLPPYSNIRPICTQKLPVLGHIAAGEPIFMAEEREVYVETPIQADFILIASGDSMTGARINDGDLVFIRQQPTVENGEIAAVAVDDCATLKRFYRYGDDLIVLRSENPAYKDQEYHAADGRSIRILGLAVAFQSDVK